MCALARQRGLWGGGEEGISRHFSIISSRACWRGVVTSGGRGAGRREVKAAGRNEEALPVSSPRGVPLASMAVARSRQL